MTRSHGSPASAAHDAAEAGNSRNSMAISDAPRADPFGRPVRSSTFGVGGLPGTVVAPEDLETQTTTVASCIDEEGRGKKINHCSPSRFALDRIKTSNHRLFSPVSRYVLAVEPCVTGPVLIVFR